MRVSSGGRAQHGQRDDQDRLDDMALWSSTHEAPTSIMNSVARFIGNNRVPVCGQSSTGPPLLGAGACKGATEVLIPREVTANPG